MAFKKILIDTNICIDAALYRRPYAESALKIIEGSEKGVFTGYVAAHSFDTIFYLLRSDFSKSKLYIILESLRASFSIADINKAVIDNAIQLKWADFEDAIHYQAALQANCEAIITRNKKDFKKSSLPVISPYEFLELQK